MNKQYAFRLSTTSFMVVLFSNVSAQGWFVDEVSKDNDGGFFVGILGFCMLLGIIWVISHIFERDEKSKGNSDIIDNHEIPYKDEYDDEDIDPKLLEEQLNNINNTQEPNNKENDSLYGDSQDRLQNINIAENQNNNSNEQVPKTDSCYVYYRVINGEECVDIIHYISVFNDGFSVESYAINKDGIDYYKDEYHGISSNNIHEKGIIVAKEEFEKWRNRIDDFKLKIEKLIVSNTVPYGNKWKEGDYLYFPVKEILHELNRKLKKENNESYLEGDDSYNGPDFSLLHVTKADIDAPEGFYISISEDYISCKNEQSGPQSLKYYISNYNRAHLISKDDYENARDLIQNQLIYFIKELQSYT